MSTFSRFISAHAGNTLSAGIQVVLIAWLAVAVLRLPPAQVGWVQGAVLVPNLLILFWVGAIVDKVNPARFLMIANGGLSLIHAAFYIAYVYFGLSLLVLISYAVALGVASALVQNAREVLVGRVASLIALQKTVSTVTLVQFCAQAIGVALASLTDWIGVEFLILVQCALCLSSLMFYWSIAGRVEVNRTSRKSFFDGFSVLWQIKDLRVMVALVAFNGLMHLGMFMVLLPLIGMQILGYDAFAYGLLQLSFIVGSVVVSYRLARGAVVAKPGQHVLFALLYSGAIGFALSAGPTPFGLYAIIFFWGVVAGGSANHSRVIVQSMAPDEMRGRTMGIYQFALFGSAPIGAVLAGYLVHLGGIELPLKVIGASSVGLFAVMFFYPRLWAYQSPT